MKETKEALQYAFEEIKELEEANKRLLAALEYFIKYGYDEDVCKKAHDGVAYDE